MVRSCHNDRIAHCDPTGAAYLIHDEGVALGRKQEALVAERRERGVGPLGLFDDGQNLLHRRMVRFTRRGREEQSPQPRPRQHYRDAQPRAQKARGIVGQREPPPERFLVIDVLVREKADPPGPDDHHGDAEQPGGRQRPRDQ